MKSVVDRFEPKDLGFRRSLNALTSHGDNFESDLQKEAQKAEGAQEGEETAFTILAEALAQAEGEAGIIATFFAPCVCCGDQFEILCDIEEFSPDMHYCGKDPRCCP